jgi:hypothetical protein
MKHTLFSRFAFWTISILAGTLLTLSLPLGGADPSRCYSIRDPDTRRMCIAQAKKDRTACYGIRSRDRRYLCLALVTGDKQQCYNIRDQDQKNKCVALTGK